MVTSPARSQQSEWDGQKREMSHGHQCHVIAAVLALLPRSIGKCRACTSVLGGSGSASFGIAKKEREAAKGKEIQGRARNRVSTGPSSTSGAMRDWSSPLPAGPTSAESILPLAISSSPSSLRAGTWTMNHGWANVSSDQLLFAHEYR